MQNRTRTNRRLLELLTALFIVVGIGVTTRPSAAHESLTEIITRWRGFIRQYRDVERDIRVPESKRFFAEIPWDNLEYLCFEGCADVGPDSTDLLKYILHHRLEVAPPPVETMIAFIDNSNFTLVCKEPILLWAHANSDSLAPDESGRLARAFLRYAGSPDLPASFRDRFHIGAAAVCAEDTLMQIMMAAAQSADTTRVNRGLRMLAASADPAAADSLAAEMRRLRAARSPSFDRAIDLCGSACAERAFDLLVESYQHPWSGKQRLRALITLIQVPRREAYEVLLGAYVDGGEITDATFGTQGAARSHYYELWLATRAGEAKLLDYLRSGDEEEALLSVELFDRALRFGPMDDDEGVVEALETLAGRTTGYLRDRTWAVRERALDPPQGRRQKPEQPPQGQPGGIGEPSPR